MSDTETDFLGEAVADVYEETKNETRSYTEQLTGSSYAGSNTPRQPISRPTKTQDIDRIMGGYSEGSVGSEFYEEAPVSVKRQHGNSEVNTGSSEVVDEEVPGYNSDIDIDDGQYTENYKDGSNTSYDIDNPSTVRGKIISVIYLCVMFCMLLFGLNFMIDSFKSNPDKAGTFDLNGVKDQVEGKGTEKETTHKQIESIFGTKKKEEPEIIEQGNKTQTTVKEDKSIKPTSEGNKTVGEMAVDGITSKYATYEELKALVVEELTYYGKEDIKYYNDKDGIIEYLKGNTKETINSKSYTDIVFIQLDSAGIVLKSPYSGKYLYVLLPVELTEKVSAKGVATVRIYHSLIFGEVYADITEISSVIDKSNNVKEQQPKPTEQPETKREKENLPVTVNEKGSVDLKNDLDKQIEDNSTLFEK